MSVSRELGKNRVVEAGGSVDMPAGLAAGAELAADGAATEPEVGVGRARFLIRVAAEDLMRLLHCTASAYKAFADASISMTARATRARISPWSKSRSGGTKISYVSNSDGCKSGNTRTMMLE